MYFIVTLNTEESEFNDIELDLPGSSSVDDVVKAAVDETTAHIDEVTSVVIVAVI